MKTFITSIGLLASLVAIVLVTFFLIGDLGQDSDPVVLGIIGCALVAGVSFWWSTHGMDDAPRGGGR